MIEELNIDFEMGEFEDNFDSDVESNVYSDRYIKPPITVDVPEHFLKYEKAVDLVKKINFQKLDRIHCIVGGGFIFGDFIEAFIVENNIEVRNLSISTLSMSQSNIDSIANLINGNYVNKFNLIISAWWFAHERRQLMLYAYQELDKDNKTQIAAAGVHTKVCLIETTGGKKIVIHGSANLRSSGNAEQFCIEDSAMLFDFYNDFHNQIIEKYKTINKPVRDANFVSIITNNK